MRIKYKSVSLPRNESILSFNADTLRSKVLEFLLKMGEVVVVVNSKEQLGKLRVVSVRSTLVRAKSCEDFI